MSIKANRIANTISTSPVGSPFSPIKSLPNEILALIFLGVVREATTTLEHPEAGLLPTLDLDELHHVRYPETLARVCSAWYRNVTATPRLWTFIALSTSLELGPYGDLESYARNRLSKSGVQKLTLRIEMHQDLETIRRALEIVVGPGGAVAAQWENLAVESLSAPFHFLSYPIPALKHVDILLESLGDYLPEEPMFPDTALLTSLRLYNETLSPFPFTLSMYHQVTTLGFSAHCGLLLRDLGRFTKLEHLTLYLLDGVYDEHIVELPSLRTLVFTDPHDFDVLRAFHLPRLTHLQVGHPINPRTERKDRATNVELSISRSLPSVRIFTLAGWHSKMNAAQMVRVLKMLPGLEEFIARDLNFEDPEIFWCFDSFDPTVCRHLRLCEIDGKELEPMG